MFALIFFLLASLTFGQTTGAVNIIGGKVDLSGAVHTLPAIVVANTGALPATCTTGELAVVTAATLGQQIYECSAGNVWTQQLNSGGGGGGGITVYSGTGLTVTANTYYIPIGGGGTPSTTETNVDVDSPSAATVTNLFVQQSVAIGAGNTATYTWRKNGSSQSVTCQIAGASATSCSDTTHSFNVSQGDLVTIQLVTTGTIVVTPNILIATQFGTTGSNGTVNAGVATHCAYYAGSGTAISDAGSICPTSGTVTITVCSGTIALQTSAVGSASHAETTATCTGLVTTDTIQATFNGSPLAVTGFVPATAGMLGLIVWPTSNTINVSQVNNTGSSITPGAITLNYRVVR